MREQFGQVLVEGMACGLPAIAVDAHGPADIVSHGETGWLVEPDDSSGWPTRSSRPSTARTSAAAAARTRPPDVADRYAWPALARDVAALYDEARDGAMLATQ